MAKLLLFSLLAIMCAVVAFVVTVMSFYRGGYVPPETPEIYFEEILVSPAQPQAFTDQPVFTADPVGGARRGVLLVDTGHGNSFSPLEIVTLLSRVGDRGYAVEFLPEPEKGVSKTGLLADHLRQADAFLVISPTDSYLRAETDLVADFVQQGGRVLLVADPGRRDSINDLSESLGVSFRFDYLYNIAEHDSNFQEVYVRDFRADAVTSGINEMVFYYAGSLESAGAQLALTDENTHSSIAERVAPRAPLAFGAHRNVLAVYDLTFMIPPFNAVRDNDRLVANLADFLTEGERQYRLADFPRFFDGDVDILLGQPGYFALGAQLRQSLARQGVRSEVRAAENLSRDLVFLGSYADSARVAGYLEAAGVRVNGDTLNAAFTQGLPLDKNAVIIHHRAGERDVLALLSDTAEGLGEAVELLESGAFRSGLASDFAGVYETE